VRARARAGIRAPRPALLRSVARVGSARCAYAGETGELKTELASPDIDVVKDAVKKVRSERGAAGRARRAHARGGGARRR
jgi:hypothetical protein